jgi:hypothetical protein
MDKYMKFVLTIIAVGIIGINFHLIKDDIISNANAASGEVHKIAICDEYGNNCASIRYTETGTGKKWYALATR